ncbi:hypothetical protein ABTF70_19320, partial [Acinetobacter baumannii]
YAEPLIAIFQVGEIRRIRHVTPGSGDEEVRMAGEFAARCINRSTSATRTSTSSIRTSTWTEPT